MSIKVGLIGCGSIGTVIAEAIDNEIAGEAELLAVYDILRENAEKLIDKLSKKPVIAKTAEELIKRRDIQLVIEAASQKAVKEYAIKILEEGKDLMVMSTGALLDDELLKHIMDCAKRANTKIYVPSGAIVGLDNLKSATIGKIYEVILTTRKPAKSFEDSISKKELDKIKKPTLIYEGPAKEAVKLFPKNINVAASLSLAGVGPYKTKVRIIADPEIKEIIHEIHVRGEFGEMETKTVNKPFPENPRTSYIAALSAIATLKKITENLIVGT